MTFHAIDLRDPSLPQHQRERLCWLYYDEIYRAAFPIADEAESPTEWIPLLADTAHQPITHILLAISDERPSHEVDASSLLAGLVAIYLPASATALLTYVCTRPDVRRQGVVRFLLDRSFDCIRGSAGALVPYFAEVDDPDLVDPSQRDVAMRRLQIFGRLGFQAVPIRYRQPSLGPGKHAVDTLKLLLFTGGAPRTIDVATVRDFIAECYAVLDAGPPDETHMFGGRTSGTIATIALD